MAENATTYLATLATYTKTQKGLQIEEDFFKRKLRGYDFKKVFFAP